jgi:segregation and condensation protein B
MKLQLLETILYLENQFMREGQLEQYLRVDNVKLQELVKQLDEKLEVRESALKIVLRDGKIGLQPKSEILEELAKVYEHIHKKRFSDAALEVLGIIAFKQPYTKSEVEKIRGVDSSYHIKNLLNEGFIKVVGKKEGIGNATLYGTTEQFLHYFGLKSLKELPNIDDFKTLYQKESFH